MEATRWHTWSVKGVSSLEEINMSMKSGFSVVESDKEVDVEGQAAEADLVEVGSISEKTKGQPFGFATDTSGGDFQWGS
jgi:hypothetical protein